jgi:hypothetical protein
MSRKLIGIGLLSSWVIARNILPVKVVEFKAHKIKVINGEMDSILSIDNQNRIFYNSIEVWYDDTSLPAAKVVYRYPFRTHGIKVVKD